MRISRVKRRKITMKKAKGRRTRNNRSGILRKGLSCFRLGKVSRRISSATRLMKRQKTKTNNNSDSIMEFPFYLVYIGRGLEY